VPPCGYQDNSQTLSAWSSKLVFALEAWYNTCTGGQYTVNGGFVSFSLERSIAQQHDSNAHREALPCFF
jgi:hypothetical protein